jgi:surfeit locus 1 family protein
MSPPRTGGRRFLFFGAAVVGVIVFVALGAWQVQRLAWKRDLIARVDARLQAPPIEAPGAARFDALEHEFRRVTLRGRFLNDRETLVQATTKLGGGYWVLTPFVSDDDFTVLVNRGFVETSRRDARDWTRIDGPTGLRGLVRVSEPGGGFLRGNRPADDRWYSRDVDAIARARDLGSVAPYFVDADVAESPAPGAPTGGLTVVRFRNNHLQYALTWFALAALLAVAAIRAYLQERSITRAARE